MFVTGGTIPDKMHVIGRLLLLLLHRRMVLEMCLMVLVDTVQSMVYVGTSVLDLPLRVIACGQMILFVHNIQVIYHKSLMLD
mgnify:CR=1 FL=1